MDMFKQIFYPSPCTILHLNDHDEDKVNPEFKLEKRIPFENCFYSQKFSLPEFIIDQIFEIASTAHSKLYQKLIQTCKYFFSKNRKILVNELRVFYQKPDHLDPNNRVCVSDLPPNFWITNKVSITLAFQNQILNNIIPKIYRCDAIFVHLGHGYLTEKEFDVFVNPDTLEFLNLTHTDVIDSDDIPLNITKLIGKLPNTKYFL